MKEVQSILSCYRRSMSGSFEIAIVKGSSGAGKSFLTQLVGSSIVSEGGIFLVRKFDQMQQLRPFSGLAEALDQYCALLIDQLGSNWVNTVVDKLRSALGRDASYLIKIIPKLSLSNQSPIAFALFGVQLSTMGNIPVGRRFSLLAMALLDKLKSKEYDGEVMFLVARVSCLVEPCQSIMDLHTRAEVASLVAGDVQNACINRNARSVILFWSGAKLEDVNRGISQALHFIQREFDPMSFLLMSYQGLVLALMGNKAKVDLDARVSEQNDANHRQLMLALVDVFKSRIREFITFLTFYSLPISTGPPSSFLHRTSFPEMTPKNVISKVVSCQLELQLDTLD
ncbi:hypothetical protein ACHAWO_008754 [Cyclotella atomus]|uniref:Orc1-like AAA ATPase domain-containing protein n=1 Tax=Cyclotella atomus TaxID=382360 RepID=A0ABD3NS39_9STRA